MAEWYDIWLSSILNLSPVKKREIVEQTGSAKVFYEMKQEERANLKKKRLLPEKEAENTEPLLTPKQLLACERATAQGESYFLRMQERMQRKGIWFVTEQDVAYPDRLRNIADRPYGLFIKGALRENLLCVAIVGTRACSSYGGFMARQFGERLGAAGVCIVSGLAKGIDSITQEAALQTGAWVLGVLGCGVDVCYPRENMDLYERMSRQGALISEYIPGMQPNPLFFPARNRMISGLADCVLVVEAKEKSGSLITGDCALEQGKDLYAVPGRLTDPCSAGCNYLIKQGAGIVLSPEDLLEELLLQHRNRIVAKQAAGQAAKEHKNFTDAEKAVFSVLDFYPQSLEALEQALSGVYTLTLPELLNCLMKLSLVGKVEQVGGSYYCKKTNKL